MLLNRKSYVRKLSDEEIISLYKDKQWTSCIDELYQRYAHMVFGVCMKYVKQNENAEDLTLSLFASLTEKLLHHQVQHFKSWLYVLSRNHCLMQLRKNKKHDEINIDEYLSNDEIPEYKTQISNYSDDDEQRESPLTAPVSFHQDLINQLNF